MCLTLCSFGHVLTVQRVQTSGAQAAKQAWSRTDRVQGDMVRIDRVQSPDRHGPDRRVQTDMVQSQTHMVQG